MHASLTCLNAHENIFGTEYNVIRCKQEVVIVSQQIREVSADVQLVKLFIDGIFLSCGQSASINRI